MNDARRLLERVKRMAYRVGSDEEVLINEVEAYLAQPTAWEAASVKALRALTEDDPAYNSHHEPEDERPGDACLLCDLDNLSPAAAALLAQREELEALVGASRHKHGVGEKWETMNCRLCFSSWRMGAEEAHYTDCVFADENFARRARAALREEKAQLVVD